MRPRARTLLPVLLAAIGLAVAGCANSDTPGGTASGSDGGSSAATVAFATPAEGAQVQSPVDVSFNVTGVKIGKPETGDMHFHVYVDDSTDYKIIYATSAKVDVPAGQHTLRVVIAQPNHTETSTTSSEKVDVAGGGVAPTTTASGGYTYP